MTLRISARTTKRTGLVCYDEEAVIVSRKFLHPAFLAMLFLRVGESFLFFVNPLSAYLLWLLLDTVDTIPWRDIAGLTSLEYELADKWVDSFTFIMMLVSSLNSGVFNTLLVLFLFRLLGQALFFKTKRAEYLIVFANFFEAYWVWAIILVPLNFLNSTSGVVLVFSLKIIQELVKHYFGPKYIFPVTDRLWNKKRLEN